MKNLTFEQWVQLCTAVGVLLGAVVSLAGLIVSRGNSKKADAVLHSTNGMKAELVEAVRKGSLATGNLQGRAEQTAEAGGKPG